MYLNIGDNDEADIMLLKNKLKEQQKNFETNTSQRMERSKEKRESAILQYREKTGKLMKQIELLEIAVQRRDRSANEFARGIVKVTYEALSSYACICEKLKVHAGSHGKVYSRRDLVTAVHSLEEKSTVLLNIIGPSVDLSIVKGNFRADMLSKKAI